MLELVQQLAVLDALLSNWDGVLIRMGAPDPLRDQALAAAATRLAAAQAPDDIDLALDDLLDIVEDTPAYDYVRALIARAQIPASATAKTRGAFAFAPIMADDTGMLGETSDIAGKTLGKVIGIPLEPYLVKVYFATNRKSSGPGDEIYTGDPDPSGFSCGLAEVTIPIGAHRTGSLEQRKWWQPLRDKDDPRRYVVLGRIDKLSHGDFSLRLAADTDPSRDLLVFVHGYNVTFEDAARRAAQFAFDLKFNGPVLLYSWPSLGSLPGYSADEERAFLSSSVFSSFLQTLEDGPWRNVHLLAHSMGNRVMLYGLTNQNWPNSKLGQVVFVAADVYTETFSQLFPKISSNGQHYTSYASKKDRALLLSSILHKADRIGICKGEPFVMAGLETIDATRVDTGLLGHGYFAEKESIISDIAELLDKGHTACQRHLNQPLNKPYWNFDRNGKTGSSS
jgi:esterase/lipase superfamily enzyme